MAGRGTTGEVSDERRSRRARRWSSVCPERTEVTPVASLAVLVYAIICYLVYEYSTTCFVLSEFKTFWLGSQVAGVSLLSLSAIATGLLIVYVVLDLCSKRPLSMPNHLVVPYCAALVLLLGLLAYVWVLWGVRHWT